MLDLTKEQSVSAIEQNISATESQISHLTLRLEKAKEEVQEWVEANAALSQSATEARAETQSMGRGLGGAILGSKYRAASRRTAASINAGIARDVASKRAQIKEGKRIAQAIAKDIKSQISQLKADLKCLKSQKKELSSKKKETKQSVQSLNLLQKLHEVYELGLLTEGEYEEKRQKLVEKI
ncbi:hypothetical protein C1752_01563 [Acaryochloris thomasi RCC1774]|uniref:SHOCT domain-containing protein n=1 Tax=Acaryochloris thomasi RCC1774 TaxID=1764569 RepID=A0A2W1JL84_9CYAN|nr:hypothetical protein [Acaryochloris thomasi]PZD73946.1 hypothetical protein C1752_01563 [Acaryochloris thomasi RCC1774]